MKHDFDEIVPRRNTMCAKWDTLVKQFGNADAIPMWVADMDFKCPRPIVDAMMRRAESGVYGYPYLHPDFAAVTKEWLLRRHGWQIDESAVVFCSGIVTAMYTVVQAFTAPGERVLLQRPVYYPFSNAVTDNGRVIENCPLILQDGKYGIDFDALERCAAKPGTKLMLLCNPHNPVGRVYTADELSRIGAICKAHGLILFADEIHADFVYPPHVHTPISALSPELAEITVTAISPSKTFNIAGLRSAAMIVPNPKLRERLQRTIESNRSSAVSTFGLDAYIAAYRDCDTYLEQLLCYLAENIAFLRSYLSEHMPKIRLIEPEGTYLMWLDCRALGWSDDELNRFFTFDSGVAFDGGTWFGEEGAGFVRMNIACPRAILKTALDRIRAQYERQGQ